MRQVLMSGAVWLLVVTQAGCAPAAAPGPASPSGQGPPAADEGASKTLVLAQLNPLLLGPWGTASTTGGGYALMGVHSTGLVSLDSRGNKVARVAAGLPSLADGSIVLLPDGRMRTTWRLRPDVTWQDGTPFAAEDVVFSHRALIEVPPGGTDVNYLVEQAEAVDPQTVALTWKNPYYDALFLDFRNFWLVPRHLLASALDEAKGNAEAFLTNPYFTTEFVNLGPFRLKDWAEGTEATFERYSGYFLGVPKVGRLIVKVIPDQNAVAAGLRAGAIDIVAERALTASLSVILRDEWQGSGEGVVLDRQANWKGIWFQWDSQWARPPEVPRDARLRAGLYEAIDRKALQEFVYPGIPNTNSDSFVPALDPRAPIVGQPFARYAYDPDKAVRDLVAAGWSRGADGRFLDRSGSPVQFEVRASQVDGPQIAVIADHWRKIGIDAKEFISTLGFSPRAENAQFPGVQLQARGAAEGVFPVFDSRLISRPENNYTGVNTNNYANPTLDRLIDQLYSTLDSMERGPILKQMGEVMADDLPTLPTYWQISFLVMRTTVRGPLGEDFKTADPIGYNGVRNAHLWERA